MFVCKDIIILVLVLGFEFFFELDYEDIGVWG